MTYLDGDNPTVTQEGKNLEKEDLSGLRKSVASNS